MRGAAEVEIGSAGRIIHRLNGVPASVACCFCGASLPADAAVHRRLSCAPTWDAAQELFCHQACLRERVRPGVPLMFDGNDEAEVGS
jgi:hypothetical protein